MQVLDISTDLGPSVPLAHLEQLVRGIRVAADVAQDADTRRVRRAISERMKYPTDAELRAALERLPYGEQGTDLGIERQLAARDYIRHTARELPLWRWREPDDYGSPAQSRDLADAGYDRLLSSGFPFSAIALDILDSALYETLVADEVTRSLPGAVAVRTLRYANPFLASLFGKESAAKTVSTTVEVIEVARDFGPKRAMAKAEAAVAKATVENRIVESDIDVAIKQEQLVEARLRNRRLALENARIAQAIDAEQQHRILVERAMQQGQVDIADAIRALDTGDAKALGDLGHRPLEIEEYSEADDSN
jgi:hypothetical protein